MCFVDVKNHVNLNMLVFTPVKGVHSIRSTLYSMSVKILIVEKESLNEKMQFVKHVEIPGGAILHNVRSAIQFCWHKMTEYTRYREV
jgi:hypothetical protein